MKKITLVFVSGLIVLFTVSVAAEDTLVDAVRGCKKIDHKTKRLACFDALAPEQQKAETKTVTPSKKYSENDFGAEDLSERLKQQEKERPQNLISGLVEFGKNQSGKYFFILANGQIWKQAQSDTSLLRIPRDLNKVQVVIKRKFLGSHSLRIKGKKRSIKVKRFR